MKAIKTHFDGKQVIIPQEYLRKLTPGEVVLIVSQGTQGDGQAGIMKAEEEVLKKVWENEADAAYDSSWIKPVIFTVSSEIVARRLG